MKAAEVTEPAQDIRLQVIAAEHIPGAVLLSQEAAGLLHRPEDWALTLSVSGGVVALDGDRVIGTALCSSFGAVAMINMIIVAQDYRGCGLGRRLMGAVLALAAGQEQRLTATADGLPLYEKLGFMPVGEVLQYQGMARSGAPRQPVQTGGPADMAAFSAADLGATGMDRTALLEQIARIGQVLITQGGFALLRPFGRGYVVGPVIARHRDAACALIAEAASRCQGRFLRVDLPAAAMLGDFVANLGLGHAGGGIAMIRAPGPAHPKEFTTYALASQALG